MKLSKNLILIIFILTGMSLLGYFLIFDSEVKKQDNISLDRLKNHLGQEIYINSNLNPSYTSKGGDHYSLVYSVNRELENYVRKRLRYYRPDMSAVVVIESKTGNILTAIGFDRKERAFDYRLPYTGTHPSASIFKIITSAELLEEGKVSQKEKFIFRGRGTTLYKYQLRDKKSRWNRSTTFSKAFAFSNNVVFGKAAIENTTPVELKEMAERLGFNQELMDEINLSKSTFQMPKNGYNLAEIASGFNKKTLMSPVHCAALSTIVVNQGEFVTPRLALRAIDNENQIVWENEVDKRRVVTPEVSAKLEELMKATVTRGTARRKFRRMRRSVKNKLVIGGKTGSITGGFPMGKRDWFSAFAYPKSDRTKGISVCVMNINFEKWYVKSTKLAQEIIQYYYSKIIKVN